MWGGMHGGYSAEKITASDITDLLDKYSNKLQKPYVENTNQRLRVLKEDFDEGRVQFDRQLYKKDGLKTKFQSALEEIKVNVDTAIRAVDDKSPDNIYIHKDKELGIDPSTVSDIGYGSWMSIALPAPSSDSKADSESDGKADSESDGKADSESDGKADSKSDSEHSVLMKMLILVKDGNPEKAVALAEQSGHGDLIDRIGETFGEESEDTPVTGSSQVAVIGGGVTAMFTGLFSVRNATMAMLVIVVMLMMFCIYKIARRSYRRKMRKNKSCPCNKRPSLPKRVNN
jgi:hypothetical protein